MLQAPTPQDVTRHSAGSRNMSKLVAPCMATRFCARLRFIHVLVAILKGHVGQKAARLSAMQELPFISIVITTYNRPDALAAVLRACFAQNDRHFEIIIADDGSSANTRDRVDALRAASPVPLRHVWQPDLGFRAAMVRNRGTLAARGDYIVFLDGDCIPQCDFIKRHRHLACPGYLVTGSRVLLDQACTAQVLAGRLDPARAGAARLLALRLRGRINKLPPLLVRLPDLGRARHRFSWRRIKSCNLGVWRTDLDIVGGFDESFTGWGYEDADLVLRLFHAGVMRKDGAFATEVFHLWHHEHNRNRAASNLNIVLARAADKTILATQGLHTH